MIIIGVCGGSGSGKSELAHALAGKMLKAQVIGTDNFYKDLSHLPVEERDSTNFDSPDSYDFFSLEEVIRGIKEGKTDISLPVYDFKTHTRTGWERVDLTGKTLVIFEGIFLFSSIRIRDSFDFRIFVEASSDERLSRRLSTCQERGWNWVTYLKKWREEIEPGYLSFVLPGRAHADLIIPSVSIGENAFFERTLRLLCLFKNT